jgi:hypothetical protein
MLYPMHFEVMVPTANGMDRPCLPAHPSSGAPQHEDLSHAHSSASAR